MRLILTFLMIFFATTISKAQECFVKLPYDGKSTAFYVGAKSGVYNYSFGTATELYTDLNEPLVMCVDDEGNYKHKIIELDEKRVFIRSVVTLGNDNVFVLATCLDEDNIRKKLWIAVINPDIEVISQNYIYLDKPYVTFGFDNVAILNENDEIVVITQIADYISDNSQNYDYAFYKINEECQITYSSCLRNTAYVNKIDDFKQVPGKNVYSVFGFGMYTANVQSVFYVDDDFNYLYCTPIDNMNYYPFVIMPYLSSVYWLNDETFIMSAMSARTHSDADYFTFAIKLDADMNILSYIDFERTDTTDYISQFGSIVYHNSNTIYVSSYMFDTNPNDACVYLLNENLQLLGKVLFKQNDKLVITSINAADDEGCIVNGFFEYGNYKLAVAYKLRKTDFVDNTNIMEQHRVLEARAYPNPVETMLNINIDNVNDKSVYIDIFDILGKKIVTKDVIKQDESLVVDLSALGSGVYFYRLFVDNQCVLRETFVKK